MEYRKIILASPIPPPMGGIASWTLHVLNFFENNYSEIDIIHYNTAVKGRRITDVNIFKRIYYGILQCSSVIFGILILSIRKKPDLIHITSSASLGLVRDLLLLLLLRMFNFKTCIHFRFGRIPNLDIMRNWEWKLLIVVCRISNKVIVIDSKSYDVLNNKNIRNLYYLPNPISDKIENINKKFETDKRIDGEVLFVGHVTKNKGIFELVKACDNNSMVSKLIVIGPYEISVYNKILEMVPNIKDRIIFEGNQNIEFIIEKMHNCAVFVLPSYTEGFPNVILEAMSCRAPIVATDVGAIPEMLGIINCKPVGICIKPKDEDILKNAIIEVLSNNKYVELGLKAKERVDNNYSMKKVMKELVSIWSIK